MNLDLELQDIFHDPELPADEKFREWVRTTLEAAGRKEDTQLAIRIVDEEESAMLNERWRHRKGATNVMSFAMSGLDLIAPEVIGDIVICAPVVTKEADEQNKQLYAHWAHMVVHGVLHLLGYDHKEEADAEKMESLEKEILKKLGYPDPYESE